MKTKWMMIPVVALALGCTREMDIKVSHVDGEITLYATSGEQETRTSLQQDGSIYWSPSDQINVFYGDKSGVFVSTNTVAATSAEFKGILEDFVLDGTTEFVAAYPYSKDNVYSGSTLTLNLPSIQMGEKGTFVEGLFPSVAKSTDYNLHFYNVCGGVKFSLDRGDIKKVVFRGNNDETLSGRLAVEFLSDGIPTITGISDGITSVSLIAPGNGTFEAKRPYYLVIAPQELTKGYTVELYADELVETITSDSPVTVRRSVWGVLKDLGTEIIAVPEMVDLGLSVKWASFNLGATTPEQPGYYYAWAETEPKWEFSWANWKWCEGTYETIFKYGSYNYDNRYNLEMEDDAAHVKLGDEWRMPTAAEREELYAKCSITTDFVNGMKVFKVTSDINGNSIYLPMTGYYNSEGLVNENAACFWTSSFFVYGNAGSCYLYEYAQDMTAISSVATSFFQGFPIRPVYGGLGIPVEKIELDQYDLTLFIGETATLTATVSPDNATLKDFTWSCSNSQIATVSSTGEVVGVGPGKTTIYVNTVDGRKQAYCIVTVNPYDYSAAVPEVVDLGLPSGLKWASFNLGATAPEEYGDYFAWGDTQPYYTSQTASGWKFGKEAGYVWSSYQWSMGSNTTLTKYCTASNHGYNGFTDGKSVLDRTDDAAMTNLGGKWRMPTVQEMDELRNECIWEWTVEGGVNGCLVTGPNGNSIFLPAAGIFRDTYARLEGYHGFYWSKSLYTNYSECSFAHVVEFGNDNTVGSYMGDRCDGGSIRPVYDDNLDAGIGEVFWENDGTRGSIQWDDKYRFALEGKDNGGVAAASFPENIWNVIKNGTFYLLLESTDPYIRVTTGWWEVYWNNQDIYPGSEYLTDNGDGTWTLRINFAGDPIVDAIDEHDLLFTGINYTPLKLYYYPE